MQAMRALSWMSFRECVTLLIGSCAAAALFGFGLHIPYALRVRGDAARYLQIAHRFKNVWDALGYAGDRSAGMPLFDFVAQRAVRAISPEASLQARVNTICVALFIIHLGSAWVFSGWTLRTGVLTTRNARLLMFILLGTCPALIGYTTTPLTDTLAIDLVLAGIALVGVDFDVRARLWRVLAAGVAGSGFALAILLRPAYLAGIAALLLTGSAVSFGGRLRTRGSFLVASLACIGVLAPFSLHCASRYEAGLCLQSAKTFDATRHAQVGLRGARVLWYSSAPADDVLPVLPDAFMMAHFYEPCRLTAILGGSDSSLSGCLLSRPGLLPIYVLKKWIGLFDHFRFTPYLELKTPAWLRWLSRTYDSLFWVGLALLPVWTVNFARKLKGARMANAPLWALCAYSLAMLAEHTLLHVEDRFGLPVLPLCALSLVAYAERLATRQREGWLGVRGVAIYLVLAWALFIAQIIHWDADQAAGSPAERSETV